MNNLKKAVISIIINIIHILSDLKLCMKSKKVNLKSKKVKKIKYGVVGN